MISQGRRDFIICKMIIIINYSMAVITIILDSDSANGFHECIIYLIIVIRLWSREQIV